MPVRIQRRRTKGWRMPEGAVYVGRPSKWGNPWRAERGWCLGPQGQVFLTSTDREYVARHAVKLFEQALVLGSPSLVIQAETFVRPWITLADVRRELVGRDLACWCPLGTPCHADVLLYWAKDGAS